MAAFTTLLLVIIGAGVLLLLYGIATYNGLVQLRNRFQNAFAQIDVQLKRRYDLIPNLVETAKGYLKHERETLEAVIAARNTAASASSNAAAHPGDPGAIKGLVGAEAALTGAMGKFFALAEAYPDLKANQNMMQLTEELTSTENKIAFSPGRPTTTPSRPTTRSASNSPPSSSPGRSTSARPNSSRSAARPSASR